MVTYTAASKIEGWDGERGSKQPFVKNISEINIDK
jgi:hypothetical protein